MPQYLDANGNPLTSTPTKIYLDANGNPVSSASTQPQVSQEGLLHAIGAQFGITPEANAAREAELNDHPVVSTVKTVIGGPGLPAAEGLYQGAKRSGSELFQAAKDAFNRNRAGAVSHVVTAIPIVGPALDKMADAAADNGAGKPGNSYADDLKATLTSPRAMGTGIGAALQVAPMALGAADAVLPGRTPLPNPSLPRKANAIKAFDKLNSKLADQPVNLKSTLEPLQRATEIGVRGGSLPKAVSDLLARSQAIEPMTYPEARDYQMALTDLSRADADSVSMRMKGQIARINQGLFNDIANAANEHTPGLGGDYADAMKEYRQAAKIRGFAKDAAWVALKYGVPTGAVGGLLYKQFK